jgi:hypothetical protein
LDYREFGNTGFKASFIGMGTSYVVISRGFSGVVGHQPIEND